MLRTALLIVSLGLLTVGLGAWLGGAPGALPMMIWGAVLTAAVVFERWRYRSSATTDSDAWEQTGERFVDPESGQAMQVLYNPRTGARRYRPAPREDRPAA